MSSVPKPKRARTKHYFREWREHRKLTQERAMERLGWSQSKISRIETGRTPYNEDDLYAAADAYECTPAQLIEVNPLVDREVIDISGQLAKASPEQRRMAADIIATILKAS